MLEIQKGARMNKELLNQKVSLIIVIAEFQVDPRMVFGYSPFHNVDSDRTSGLKYNTNSVAWYQKCFKLPALHS
jgi:hypothetical protein